MGIGIGGNPMTPDNPFGMPGVMPSIGGVPGVGVPATSAPATGPSASDVGNAVRSIGAETNRLLGEILTATKEKGNVTVQVTIDGAVVNPDRIAVSMARGASTAIGAGHVAMTGSPGSSLRRP
jgi:hypothetical protein